jgi:ABC-type uncharacterized transport system substrate-binding protein
MNRRAFVTSLALGISTRVRVARAQPTPKLPIIGILASGQPRTASPYPALERALGELGLVDGQTARIEFRMAEGRIERLPGLAIDLVRSNVDVIIAGGNLASLEAARSASAAIPIVMIAVDYDPIAARMVASLNRPGGNITGVFVRQIELTFKRMELLKEIAPKAARVVMLSDPFSVEQLKAAESAARTLGLRLQSVEFRTPPYDYTAALASAGKDGAGGALVAITPVMFRERVQIAEIAARQRIPTMFPLPEFADAGGLIAYGASLDATFASAAPYIEKIIRGVKPADLPIEQPRSFELVVNAKVARSIGMSFPPVILARADRVIQ